MLFRQFINIAIYIGDIAKILNQHFNLYFFSNPGDKVQNYEKLKDKSVPYFQPGSGSFPPGLEDNYTTLKCWICIFPTFLIYVVMLEIFLNNISIFGCAPIQGTTYFLGKVQMKSWYQSGTYAFFKTSSTLRTFTSLFCLYF